jgi:hypothetical protein
LNTTGYLNQPRDPKPGNGLLGTMHRISRAFTSTSHRSFTSATTRTQQHRNNMPLVVPGVTADNVDVDKAQEWLTKLAGKKLTEGPSTETTFCKTELPEQTRVIEPGTMVTRDYRPERLNVQVTDDGTVEHVYHG